MSSDHAVALKCDTGASPLYSSSSPDQWVCSVFPQLVSISASSGSAADHDHNSCRSCWGGSDRHRHACRVRGTSNAGKARCKHDGALSTATTAHPAASAETWRIPVDAVVRNRRAARRYETPVDKSHSPAAQGCYMIWVDMCLGMSSPGHTVRIAERRSS
jgi:hypothetical protein